MTSPKSRPKMQIRMPHRRRLWPFTPPTKFTEERSGSLRLASPPVSSGFAAAKAPAVATRLVTLSAASLPNPLHTAELQWDQALVSQVRMNASSRTFVVDYRREDAF